MVWVGIGAVVFIYLAIWALPLAYVHPGSFRVASTPTATPTIIVTVTPQPTGPALTSSRTVSAAPVVIHPVDNAALEAARNDARVPIGVTAAALVAAAAAGFGVHATRRSIAASRQAVTAADFRQGREARAAKERQDADHVVARQRHHEEDLQWKQEQYAKRYKDAADQLAASPLPSRLAGVYSMARLADEWVEEAQTCIDVLCAYLRFDPENHKVSDEQVRIAIMNTIGQRLRQVKETSPWGAQDIDLGGAVLPAFDWRDIVCASLSLRGATIAKKSVLHRSIGAGSNLSDMKIMEDLQLSVRESMQVGVHRFEVAPDARLMITLNGVDKPAPESVVLGMLSGTVYGMLTLDAENLRKGGFVSFGFLHLRPNSRLTVQNMKPPGGDFDGEIDALSIAPVVGSESHWMLPYLMER